MEFPCPLCGTGLQIRATKRDKPYMTCNICLVQIFVRGTVGISRLRDLATSGILVSSKDGSVSYGINLYNRLEQLKLQKEDLERKRGLVFFNKDAVNAISVVDAEIEKVQRELEKMAQKRQK
jgi:hypothetical protein